MKFILMALAVYGLLVGRALFKLRAFQARPPVGRYSGTDEIGAGQLEILRLPREWLLAQGFRQLAWLQCDEFMQPEGMTLSQPQALYLSADGSIRCTVSPSPLPQHGIPCLLRFASTLEDGSELVTVNRAGPLPAPAHIVINDEYLAEDTQQLALHRDKIGDRACRRYADCDEILTHENALAEALFAHWQGTMLAPSGERWRLSWRGAFRFMSLLQRHNKRLKQAAPVAQSASASASRHAEAAMLQQQLKIDAPATPGKTKTGIFLLTGLAFLVLGKFIFDYEWSFMAALMLVLLIHELGHFAAMKLFGYGDLSIFFLPLLGAAAQGRKDTAPPWQQLVILLAGPVPGIVLGLLLVLLATSGGVLASLSPGLMQFGIYVVALALVINFLNLLPIMPLDGGRVAELLFFSRYPRASFGFFMAGVMALAALALWLQDPVTGFLALILALSLPFQWRLTRISRQLHPHYGRCTDQQSALALLADAFTQGAGKGWPAITRINITKALLPRLQGGVPGRATLIAGTLVYAGLLFSPVIALLAVNSNALSSPLGAITEVLGERIASGQRQQLQQMLASANTDAEKMRAHLMLHHLHRLDDATRARNHLDAAYRLATAHQPYSSDAVQVLTAYVHDLQARDPVAALRLHENIELSLAAAPDRQLLANWLQFKDALLSATQAAVTERIANRQKELALWEGLADGQHSAAFARQALARLHFRAQQPEAALAVLQANWEKACQLDGAEFIYLRDSARNDLAWAHIGMAQPALALALFSDFQPGDGMAALDEDDYLAEVTPEQTQAHAMLAAGDHAAALAAFTRLRDAYRKLDPADANVAAAAQVELDLLLAQTRANDSGVAATRQRLNSLLGKSADNREWVLTAVATAAADPENLAAGRARAHEELLRAMGYKPAEETGAGVAATR